MRTYICKHCDNLECESSICPNCGERTVIKESQVYYCNHCHTIVFDKQCSLCGGYAEPIASDFRPVFPTERALLEVLNDCTNEYMNESMWNLGASTYLLNGKKFRISYSELSRKYDRSYIKTQLDEREEEIKECEKKFYETEPIINFVNANSSYLNRITYEATFFIKEESKDKNLDEMFVSFSGGKDSTVVSDLVKNAISDNVIHIYGDTTLEFNTTHTYIHTYIHRF